MVQYCKYDQAGRYLIHVDIVKSVAVCFLSYDRSHIFASQGEGLDFEQNQHECLT